MKRLHNFLLIILAIQFSLHSNAQNCFDEIKDLPVDLLNANGLNSEAALDFKQKLNCFIGEELDSIDIQLLGNGPMLGTLLVMAVSEDSELTYGKIYDLLIKTKKEHEEYPRMRELHVLSRQIDELPALYSSWVKIRSFFSEIELSGDELEPLRVYLKDNEDPTKTMKDIRMEYREFRLKEYQENENRDESKKTKEQFERLFANSGAIDIESLILASLDKQKPILLYFTGYNCVNCRKIEFSVLNNSLVLEELDENFVFTSLYIDDRTELKKSETCIVDGKSKIAQTVGQLNMYIEISEFGISTQPYFVALDPDGKILGSTNYEESNSLHNFMQFLNRINN